MATTGTFVGVDVSKATLDVFIEGDRAGFQVANDDGALFSQQTKPGLGSGHGFEVTVAAPQQKNALPGILATPPKIVPHVALRPIEIPSAIAIKIAHLK